MLWFSEYLHLGDEGRAGAQERARMSVGDLFTPSLGFADSVSQRWPRSATGMKGEQERRPGAGANVSRRSVHAKPRQIRGRFVALERHGDDARPSVARNTNFS